MGSPEMSRPPPTPHGADRVGLEVVMGADELGGILVLAVTAVALSPVALAVWLVGVLMVRELLRELRGVPRG